MWKPAKACHDFNNNFTLFYSNSSFINMYTDKDSNLLIDLRNNYGENSVRLFRKWEITTKKMADYMNHRRFTLKCIKASITPVSCKLKAPPSFRSSKSYQIIHKAEKQLLYEHIRNINGILAMLDKHKQDQYSKFKDSIFSLNHSNTDHSSVSEPLQDLDPDTILDRARLFIHRIKDHRHDKIKRKQINKFEHLHYKIRGYHHNITRHNTLLDNIDHNDSSLSGQPNVPSSIPPRSSTPSITSTGPATPHPPTPSTSQVSTSTTQANPTSGNPPNSHTCRAPSDKWVINLSNTPLSSKQLSLLQKGPNFAITPKHPPLEAYIMATSHPNC